ncbi:MAG: tetratricopeptide repeat protein [Ignavibacteria bacterium]|nr:tetratricopeptide repeat protein [Ignavibacteria bacterium]
MKRPFDPERSMALVIGAGARFEADNLMAQTVDDAVTVSGKLTSLCKIPAQRVISKYGSEASSEAILKELDRISELTLEDPLEIFFFYFSGHGAVNDGRYYIICNNNDGRGFGKGTIRSDVLMNKLQAVNTIRMVVLLDCCHAEGMIASDDNPLSDGSLTLSKPNRVVLSASHCDQVSFLSRPVSVFTYALLEGLNGKYLTGSDKYITVFDLAMYVREKVSALSRQKQKPQLNLIQNNLTSNFAIALHPNGRPETPVFDTAFSLVTIDGKSIDAGDDQARDEEFRAENEWIRLNISASDSSDLIVSVKGDARNLNVNLLNIDSVVSKMDEAEELRKDLVHEVDPSRRKQKLLRLDRITKELNDQKENIISLARTFGRIELDQARLKKAYEEFLRGNVQSVDVILDTETLEKEQAGILRMSEEADQQKAEADKLREQNSEEFLLKAYNVLLIDDLPERFALAESHFRNSMKSYRNTKNLFAFGSYLRGQNRFREAAELFNECISAYMNAPGDRKKFRSDIASAYQNLGYCLQKMNEQKTALENFEKGVSVLEEMKEEGIDINEDLASAYSNLAVQYMEMKDHKSAETILLASLKIKKKLSESGKPEHLYSLALGFLNLGKFLSDKGKHLDSFNAGEVALNILYDLNADANGKYYPDIARAMNNMGQSLVSYIGKKEGNENSETARRIFDDCIAIRRKLCAQNIAAHGPDLATTLNGYGLFEYRQKNFGKAGTLFEEALEIRRNLAKKSPESFSDELAESLENIGMLKLNTSDVSGGGEDLHKALEIIEKLEDVQPDVFGLRLAQLNYHLAIFHALQNETEEAGSLCHAALSLAEKFPGLVQSESLKSEISNLLQQLKK